MRAMFLSVMVFTVLATTDAFAAPAAPRVPPPPPPQDTRFGGSAVYVDAGFTKGGIAFGADYENLSAQPFGLGGFARLRTKDKDKKEEGMFALGAFARPHFTKDRWDMYVSPGAGIAIIDSVGTQDDETVFGPSMAIGVLFQTTPNVALGLEDFHFYSWTGDDWKGVAFQEIMFKGRYSF